MIGVIYMSRIKLRPHKVYMTDEEYERVRVKAKAVPSEVKLRRELAAALPAHANLINKLPDNLPVKKQFIEWEEKAWQLLP